MDSNSKGERARHLTRCQRQILDYLAKLTGADDVARCTKRDISRATGCSEKTTDRALVYLRKEGLIETSACYAESGAQVGNAYRVVRRLGA